MRRDYRLYELSNDEFEQLVVQICVRLGLALPYLPLARTAAVTANVSRKANCAEFRKRCGRRTSGLRVKRGPPPGLPTVFAGSP
jgi:hypothetical protein